MTNESTVKARSTPRAEETRRHIYEVAMKLFREKGFEQTTMRDIAAKANVALGGAYYYYSSKEAIVLAFYQEMQEGHHEEIMAAVASQKKLKDRIKCVLEKRFELLAPNRKFCDALFRHAPDSEDPLSPFSEETRPIRERAMEHMQFAAEGGDVKIPADLQPQLPYMLWLYQMGLTRFWLYDRSEKQKRTHMLMEKSLGLLVSLLKLSGLPLMKPIRKTVLEMVETIAA